MQHQYTLFRKFLLSLLSAIPDYPAEQSAWSTLLLVPLQILLISMLGSLYHM